MTYMRARVYKNKYVRIKLNARTSIPIKESEHGRQYGRANSARGSSRETDGRQSREPAHRRTLPR